MYKVLIVDDEKEIRDGLIAWPWESLSLQVVGCCAHGLEALQFVAEQPVDIIMTDIRMPFMSGIELIEILKRQYPFIHVIILSGHSDFEFAQKAIQYGATDYLLKPVHFPSLSQSLGLLVNKLDEKKQVEYRTAVLKRKEEQLTQVLRDDFIRQLIHAEVSAYDMEQMSSEAEVLLDSNCYTVALFRLDRLSLQEQRISERELRLLVFSLDNILHDIWDSSGLGYHLVNKATAEFYLLSTKHDSHDNFRNTLSQWLKYMGLFKSTFSIGIGRTVEQPTDIRLSARSAERTLNGNKQESSICYFQSDDDSALNQKTPNTIIKQNIQPLNEMGIEQNSMILVLAKQFIVDHYHRSITLKEVAEHVYISQSHLSALFKETGVTYLKFLTSLRMSKAVDLLKEANVKVYEIVEMVGYSDPAYFSEVFKKFTGKTPNEYRGKFKQIQGG
ncbi:response regulator [Paenibacillus psychroresistens]|uniref:Response regulator n=1 Tax=Paenibacillus psychroresistens TaxID=1778678 RepID=A0A6B8RRJ2_9BACL|nr:response regulator [Paenibacillus psychroresistens]QGQ98165.1 response regulator [Paenibacillus psychroresistens]